MDLVRLIKIADSTDWQKEIEHLGIDWQDYADHYAEDYRAEVIAEVEELDFIKIVEDEVKIETFTIVGSRAFPTNSVEALFGADGHIYLTLEEYENTCL